MRIGPLNAAGFIMLYLAKWRDRVIDIVYSYALWIQTLSEKVLNPPNYSKLYPKHFLSRYLDP